MTQEMQLEYKHRLKLFCEQSILDRIQRAKSLVAETQHAANQEEKSSAGDKYETSRAMGHLAKDMHSRQLAEYMKELASLHTINCSTLYTVASAGAVVICQQNSFFIASGLGKQVVDNKTIIFLSPHAPLSTLLMHKKAGDHFIFNGKREEIVEVF